MDDNVIVFLFLIIFCSCPVVVLLYDCFAISDNGEKGNPRLVITKEKALYIRNTGKNV